jgi:hypothetical protein
MLLALQLAAMATNQNFQLSGKTYIAALHSTF